ncbi:hypothetical protein NAPIS_ORF02068 [Vairimorpha apis BRL 01]|uniref:Uncharacterized protein n=1 Tax=Vairimorpha apis BRL 01 TaxID=1037528 RepID=T0L766_9MICR|nr:hypothetical protein NAPIS_ORF02068 [Vairimorpha apis BRL 01]
MFSSNDNNMRNVVSSVLRTLTLKFELVEDYQPTLAGYIIHYNGECVAKKSRHKSNRTFVKITSHTLIVSCYDTQCKSPYMTETRILLTEEIYDFCFRKGILIKTQIQQYLKNIIDHGITTIRSENGLLVAQSSDMLLEKYKLNYPELPIHYIDSSSHLLSYTDKTLESKNTLVRRPRYFLIKLPLTSCSTLL